MKPVGFERLGRRLLCTFLPFLVRRQGGAGTREHWEQHPTATAFEGIDPASQVQMDEIMSLVPDRNAAILDMGCNVGRHLDYLYRQGYRNLRGVDWSSAAIRDMAQRYPEMHANSTLTSASFEEFLSASPEPVDLVYTRGATFELVHPGFPLIRHVCRIAKALRRARHLRSRHMPIRDSGNTSSRAKASSSRMSGGPLRLPCPSTAFR